MQRMDAQIQDLVNAEAARAQGRLIGAVTPALEVMENGQDLVNAAIARAQEDAVAAGISAFFSAESEKESPDSMVRSQEIRSLAKEGLTIEEIARRLDLGSGEVELILSLGKKPFWVVGSDR